MFGKRLKKQTDSEHISWTSARHSRMFFPADITVHQVSGAHLTIDNQVLVISGETKPYKTCQQF